MVGTSGRGLDGKVRASLHGVKANQHSKRIQRDAGLPSRLLSQHACLPAGCSFFVELSTVLCTTKLPGSDLSVD